MVKHVGLDVRSGARAGNSAGQGGGTRATAAAAAARSAAIAAAVAASSAAASRRSRARGGKPALASLGVEGYSPWASRDVVLSVHGALRTENAERIDKYLNYR